MERKSNLKKASTFYLVGTLFNKGIGFITVPIFTRILSVSDYGIVTTYNSWVSILMMFMSLALYMAVRASFVDYKEHTKDFLSVIITFTCLFGCLFSLIVIVISFIAPINLSLSILILCLIQALATAIIENVSMFFMMNYQYKARTALMVLPNLLSTIVSIFLIKKVLSSELYFGRIVPNAIITLLFGLMALLYSFKGTKVRFNKEYLQYGLKISVPLVLHGIALNILSQSDRTMITMIRSSEETGIYGLIYNFSMIATVITTAFDGIWVPFFTRKMNERDYNSINAFAEKYVEFMSVAMIGVILVGPEIVKLLSTKAYWEGIKIIPPIVLANYFIFIYTMYVNVEHYYKKTVFISINTTIAAVSNILLNIVFIYIWGYVGAAYTTLISYILSLILHYRYARKVDSKVFGLKHYVYPLIVIFVSVVAFYLFINNWYIRWLTAIITVVIFGVKEKDFLLNTFLKS